MAEGAFRAHSRNKCAAVARCEHPGNRLALYILQRQIHGDPNEGRKHLMFLIHRHDVVKLGDRPIGPGAIAVS